MVSAAVGGKPVEVPLFEGHTPTGAHLFVLGVAPGSRGRTAAILASAASALARDGLFSPELVIGWGETSANALAAVPSARRMFVLPDGQVGELLPPEEVEELAEADDLGAGQSLLARGLMASDALAVPSPAAAAQVASHPEFATRASDQPVAIVHLGCDDPPHDPHSDPALPHHYSADAPTGKQECRKSVARRHSLAVGQRTLLCLTPPLDTNGSATLLSALSELAGLDVAVMVRAGADRTLNERAKILAIENPGRIAVLPETSVGGQRELLAAADAVLFADPDDLTGRPAGLALRYGALPIAPDAGAFGDFLVDYDPSSRTGTALLYEPGNAFELVGALKRAIGQRAEADRWLALVVSLLRSAPRWAFASTQVESLTALTADLTTEAPAALTA
jgi:glycogen synthase